jgi:hypothetical protein
MSKRNRKPAPGTTGGRGRSSVPIKIDKPKPWGTIAVSLLLAVALIGIIVYAVLNTGSGVRDLLAEDDASFDGITVDADVARDHVAGPVDYPDYPARPPMGGEHNALPQQCAVYDAEIPAEHAVHSLEHGATWITYSPDLPADQVEELTGLAEGNPYRLLSPLPGQESPIVASAWGRQLEVDSTDDDELERFLRVYTDGRQSPEKGAACVGNNTTGTTPVTATPTDEGVMPEPEPEPEQ